MRFVIHFYDVAKGWVLCGTACGFTGGSLPYFSEDQSKVTCRRCRKALAKHLLVTAKP